MYLPGYPVEMAVEATPCSSIRRVSLIALYEILMPKGFTHKALVWVWFLLFPAFQFHNTNMFMLGFFRKYNLCWTVSWRFHPLTSMAEAISKYFRVVFVIGFLGYQSPFRICMQIGTSNPTHWFTHYSFTLSHHVTTCRYFNNYYIILAILTHVVVYLLIFLISTGKYLLMPMASCVWSPDYPHLI
jgi:hypothetical protein